jgi:predicted transcriptional regulator
MKSEKKYLFISIKEEYANQILEGKKHIELRKSRPSVRSGDHIIIYCTSPVKAIVGTALVKEVISHSPNQMWRLHSKKLGIRRKDYMTYYSNTDKAIGIVLADVQKLCYTICLSLIRKQLPTFSPPQTYKYFSNFIPAEKETDLVLELAQSA